MRVTHKTLEKRIVLID